VDYSIDPFTSPHPEQFASKNGWTDLGNNRFMAVRYRFVPLAIGSSLGGF
jgi:hypothetical protein